jgi:hypothetical protein
LYLVPTEHLRQKDTSMKTAHRAAATMVAAAAVGIGLAGPAAATTHARPGPSQDSTSTSERATLRSGRPGGGLFERIEDAIDRALHIPDPDDNPP